MLIIHPIIQFCATLLACFVFFLGLQRFRMLHLKQKTRFNWKQHVLLGIMTLLTLLAGMVGGMSMVYLNWHGFLVTGVHGKIALVILPMVLFGLISGLYMNSKKKKRKALPFIHGTVNLFLLLLAFYQMYSGWWVYNAFILGN
ncbi:MAG: DUF4079 domain-containing protein [Deltaproteobacteria bacterium]|nr:DUF4079 domain-containing protein [Deltaproteobacteria bacterium]